MTKKRGWWNTSFRDHAMAKLQADEIAAATAPQQPAADALMEAYRKGWADGRTALLHEQAARGQV